MVKTAVYLGPETAMALRQLAGAQGRSQAQLIREALEQYARNATRPLPRGMAQYRSGRSDVSQEAETLYREALREER